MEVFLVVATVNLNVVIIRSYSFEQTCDDKFLVEIRRSMTLLLVHVRMWFHYQNCKYSESNFLGLHLIWLLFEGSNAWNLIQYFTVTMRLRKPTKRYFSCLKTQFFMHCFNSKNWVELREATRCEKSIKTLIFETTSYETKCFLKTGNFCLSWFSCVSKISEVKLEIQRNDINFKLPSDPIVIYASLKGYSRSYLIIPLMQ